MSLDCSSEVANDYYGLGVRLGIYFTWFSSWIANNYVPSEIEGALDANAIFLLALMCSIVSGTVTRGELELRYIDGLILMHLCAGYLFGCFSLWGYRTRLYRDQGRHAIKHFGGFGTHFRLLLIVAIGVYGVWFWVVGVKDGLLWLTNPDGSKKVECYPLVTFFFAKLDVSPVTQHTQIRFWYIFMFSCTTAYYGLMLVVALFHRVLDIGSSKKLFALGMGHYETGLTDSELKILFQVLRWANLVWIIWVIVMVEITLYYNKVLQVLAGMSDNIILPGQLLPLLIGALGLLRVIYIRFKNGFWTIPPPEGELRQVKEEERVNEDDAELLGRGRVLRCLVTWLPWLSDTPLWTGYGDRDGVNMSHTTSFTLSMITPVRTTVSGRTRLEKVLTEPTLEAVTSSGTDLPRKPHVEPTVVELTSSDD